MTRGSACAGLGGNCIVAPDFGGAYHYGCSFDGGGDWYLSSGANDVVVGLAVAEITESYMGLQAKGWNCGGSGGEALSRVLAEIATGGASGALADYTTGPSWNGQNWIDRDSGTDQDASSTGCGTLYLWWMLSIGYTVEEIVQAGESGGVLAGNYRSVDGKTTAWADFQKAIKAVGGTGSMTNDNPWNVPTPPYPAGSSPAPAPTPGGGGGTLTAQGSMNFLGTMMPVTLSGLWSGAPALAPTASINVWAVVADLGAIYSAARADDWSGVAAARSNC